MGRLEDIIARNTSKRPRERIVVMIGFGLFVLLILVLMVFTDLGTPPAPATENAPPRDRHRVDDVLLRSVPARRTTK